MRLVSRKGVEEAVLKLFEELGRPVHVGDLKKEYKVLTKARPARKGMSERDLIAWNLRRLYRDGRLSKSDRAARSRRR